MDQIQYVSTAAVKRYLKTKGFRISKDAVKVDLQKVVEELLDKAAKRADASKRKTLMPVDFI